jgi:hypothetical protein
MDIIDLFWNYSQDRDLAELVDSQTKMAGRHSANIQRLQQENHELRIRIGVLIRMLIERGVFSADDFANLVNQTKEKLNPAASKPSAVRIGRAVKGGASPKRSS